MTGILLLIIIVIAAVFMKKVFPKVWTAIFGPKWRYLILGVIIGGIWFLQSLDRIHKVCIYGAPDFIEYLACFPRIFIPYPSRMDESAIILVVFVWPLIGIIFTLLFSILFNFLCHLLKKYSYFIIIPVVFYAFFLEHFWRAPQKGWMLKLREGWILVLFPFFICSMIYLYQWIKRKGFKIPWKKILIIMALITVGAIGFHFYEISQQPPPPPRELPVAPPIIEEPITEEETADCEKIINSNQRDNCYSTVAQATQDASLCEKITSFYAKEGCYGHIAVATKDISLCEKMTYVGSKDGCYSSIAIETKDISLCEKITDSEGGDDCYQKIAIETKDASLCEKITGSGSKDYCYKGVASVTKDVTLCEKITDSFPKDGCYSTVAQATKDASLCEKIIDSSKKDWCYRFAK